jgi:flagellar biosynthesis component FlhA
LLSGVQQAVEQLTLEGHRPVIIAPSDLRYAVWKFIHRFLPQVTFVSQQELPPRQEVQSVATVSISRPELGGPSTDPLGTAPIGQGATA